MSVLLVPSAITATNPRTLLQNRSVRRLVAMTWRCRAPASLSGIMLTSALLEIYGVQSQVGK